LSRDLLERRFGLILDGPARAGSVEMVRERTLLDQKPQFSLGLPRLSSSRWPAIRG